MTVCLHASMYVYVRARALPRVNDPCCAHTIQYLPATTPFLFRTEVTSKSMLKFHFFITLIALP